MNKVVRVFLINKLNNNLTSHTDFFGKNMKKFL